MRIISGRLGSRRLVAPVGLDTRPTSDRLRETLFNVIARRVEGAVFADLYAGSGAVGIEALSRGAALVVFVERAPAALKALRANLQTLGVREGCRIDASSVKAFLQRSKAAAPFDLAFLDPPYNAAREYAATLGLLGSEACGLLAPHALVIAEHRNKEKLDDAYGQLARTRLLEQGDAALSFYSAGAGV